MKKIIILCGLTLLLTACGGGSVVEEPDKTHPTALLTAVEKAQEMQDSVELFLSKTKSTDGILVSIVMRKKAGLKVDSIRSFLSYNPEVLLAQKIILADDLGENVLVAPNEQNFDNKQGLVRLGLSALADNADQEQVQIAQVEFKVLQDAFTTVEFFDVRPGGHTDVLGIVNGKVYNLLKKPVSPALILETSE